MKRTAITLHAAFAATPALADPLTDALKAGGGTICFTRSYDAAWLKAHPGQTLREMKFAISTRPGQSWPALRMSMKGVGTPLYLFGGCGWMEGDLNRGGQGDVLIQSFKPTSGVGCHLMTDVTGGSAEEGGDFPVAWQNGGKMIEVHLDESMAAWRSFDTDRRYAKFVKVRAADRIIRLNKAPTSGCQELVTRFAPGQPDY
jgi:hypothetical protein